MRTVLYTAAHGGFAPEIPLGGGAAVCTQLLREWECTQPFAVRLLAPAILGAGAPSAAELVSWGERRYARFCRDFEAAVTREILACDPAATVVLSNDICEGPDFQRLAERGFAVYTIFHVDVVAYIASIYARSKVQPQTLVRWYDRLECALIPDVVRLIFEKQRDAVAHSCGLIVPSESMRDVLLRCYPQTPPDKIHVIPWGTWAGEVDRVAAQSLRREFGVPNDATILLTLSRISPEKGQDLLLEALAGWQHDGPLWLFLCGQAAFMQGRRFERKLRRLAKRLRNVRVVFPGHVTGTRKQAFLALADVYVFPSRHESYGLTLLEAMRAGLPAVCLDHHGARAVMRPEFGEIVPPGTRIEMIRGLQTALTRVLGDRDRRLRQGAAARAFAASQPFSKSAARLAGLLS